MEPSQAEARTRFAQQAAMPMFLASMTFLTLVAALIVTWVDVPRIDRALSDRALEQAAELAELSEDELVEIPAVVSDSMISTSGWMLLFCLLLTWPIFWGELFIYYRLRDQGAPFWKEHQSEFFTCCVPPLRLCAPVRAMGGKIWFPRSGWLEMDDELRDHLERAFSYPMVVIALLILPVLLVEFRMIEQIDKYLWLRTLLHLSTGLIWLAFATEFIVMFSVADKKVRYCKEHWLDLAIIILPLISFLRSLRVVRATRLAKLAKIQQLSRMSRLYRLRGLTMRAFRAMLLLEFFNRLLRITPEKKLRQLREELREKESEIARLQRQISELEIEVARRKEEGQETAETA